MRDGAYIISADGGYSALKSKGISPDLIIGDFDSLNYVPDCDIKRFPIKKDDTDTLLAIKEAISQGFDLVYIFGGMGGQLDHTIANLQSLIFARKNGVNAVLCGYGQCAVVIDPSTKLSFKAKQCGRLSVFAVGSDSEGVSIEGAEYSAEGINLSPSFPLGVSNSFCGNSVNISVQKGALLIIWQGEAEDACFCCQNGL